MTISELIWALRVLEERVGDVPVWIVGHGEKSYPIEKTKLEVFEMDGMLHPITRLVITKHG